MKANHGWIAATLGLSAALVACRSPHEHPGLQSFTVRGVIQELPADNRNAVIRHEAIPGYMAAMTMPFTVREPRELAGLAAGDEVTFRLHVTEEESWIERITRTGRAAAPAAAPAASAPTNTAPPTPPRINLVERLARFAFTNEFGQPLNFADYQGQALALTFFFTRCPLPEFCPRLSKNFAGATRKLQSLPGAPTNWHFFSISFDPENDTPGILRGYGKSYGYDSNRWTFLTTSQPVIDAVTQGLGFNFRRQGTTYDHQFMTLVLDANGYRHATWPVGGDTSDILVGEILKAAAVRPAPPTTPAPR